MTYGEAGDRGRKNDRRAEAREKARALRDEQRKQERRRRIFLQGGIAVAVIAIAAIITLVLIDSAPVAAAGPLNMASDGIVIGKDFKAVRTPAVAKNEEPVATERDKKSSVVSIRVYLDYFCPVCESFEKANRSQLSRWLKSGAATVEIHPVSFLDRSSLGTRYSSRSANAAACVANYSPDDFWAFTQAMYARQPKEGTTGLSNQQINGVIRDAGVHNLALVSKCVNTERFKSWVSLATARAQTGPLPDSSVKKLVGTPTIIVDGQQYPITTSDISSATAFAAFIEQVAGSQFDSSGPSSTPTPTPTPTPAPTK